MPEETNWQVKHIKVRLEYAVKPADDVTEAPRIEFDRYEDYREFPVSSENYSVTAQPGDGPDKLILCMRYNDVGDFYSLHRLKDEVGFDFDADDDLEPREGALKVSFTYTDQNTGAEVTDTAYYPIDPTLHDFPVDDANMPDSQECELLLRQDGQEPSVYRLIYVEPGGAGAVPKCTRLRCRTTRSRHRRLKCVRLDCL
jgi:hypothetical protein